jgi:8-oxo-dGTP pyrophosphatase MutT (NUDIX family)
LNRRTSSLLAVVYVENQKGDILVRTRADGYLDHSAAGHVEVGGSYEEAAKRELAEELGIRGVQLKHVGHGPTQGEKCPAGVMSHVFDFFSCIPEPGELQKSRVKCVYWAAPEEILGDMQENEAKYCGALLVSLPIYVNARKATAWLG